MMASRASAVLLVLLPSTVLSASADGIPPRSALEFEVGLLEILDTLQGRKCLVLDTQLGGRLNHILADGSRLLKENGVVYFRELRAEREAKAAVANRRRPVHGPDVAEDNEPFPFAPTAQPTQSSRARQPKAAVP